MATTYYVWRRNDGYVSATCYDPNVFNHCPGDTFEILLSTPIWSDAHDRIENERGEAKKESARSCGSCGADIGPSDSYPWHGADEDCRAVREPTAPTDD